MRRAGADDEARPASRRSGAAASVRALRRSFSSSTRAVATPRTARARRAALRRRQAGERGRSPRRSRRLGRPSRSGRRRQRWLAPAPTRVRASSAGDPTLAVDEQRPSRCRAGRDPAGADQDVAGVRRLSSAEPVAPRTGRAVARPGPSSTARGPRSTVTVRPSASASQASAASTSSARSPAGSAPPRRPNRISSGSRGFRSRASSVEPRAQPATRGGPPRDGRRALPSPPRPEARELVLVARARSARVGPAPAPRVARSASGLPVSTIRRRPQAERVGRCTTTSRGGLTPRATGSSRSSQSVVSPAAERRQHRVDRRERRAGCSSPASAAGAAAALFTIRQAHRHRGADPAAARAVHPHLDALARHRQQ